MNVANSSSMAFTAVAVAEEGTMGVVTRREPGLEAIAHAAAEPNRCSWRARHR